MRWNDWRMEPVFMAPSNRTVDRHVDILDGFQRRTLRREEIWGDST